MAWQPKLKKQAIQWGNIYTYVCIYYMYVFIYLSNC